MIKTFRIIAGIIVIACGVGVVSFGANLLVQQLSWLMLGGFIIFFGAGVGIIQLGYAIARGRGVREAWILLMIMGNRL